ncbi:MAG: 2-phosphosulfolactate phosphatase [Bacteroidales bacterium]|nr:MAG: 2-phosphosulfolactate phosphatase [Bacteroidales bacterium]
MKIQILQYLEGAKKATGLAVVIDVFRAFSVGCYVMHNGANELIAVGDVETAFLLKNNNPDFILIGERNERKVDGFDYGNSPTHIEKVNFSGKTVVQTTSAGTQGLVQARQAERIITGSLVNADAIITYIKSQSPQNVSLIAMGHSGRDPADEDLFCAEYINAGLTGKFIEAGPRIRKLKAGSGRRFFDPENHAHSPHTDFELCTRIGYFNFILKADIVSGDSVTLRKVSMKEVPD